MITHQSLTLRSGALFCTFALFGTACIDNIELWRAIQRHHKDHGSGQDAGYPVEDAGTDAGCIPACDDRECGPDGCGGSCAPGCQTGESCNASGQCISVCTPACAGRECGSDGCGGSCAPGCSADEVCDGTGMCQPVVISFAAVWNILSMSRCPSCHTGGSPPAGLNLSNEDTAYAQLVGVAASECSPSRDRVEPGAPDASYLINKLAGTNLCAGQRMPLGGPFLTSDQIDMVRAWIADGAMR